VRVRAFERDAHEFDVVGIVLDAQQPDGAGLSGLNHESAEEFESVYPQPQVSEMRGYLSRMLTRAASHRTFTA
jgi:hypothetical protein